MLLHSLSRPGTDTLFNQFQFDIFGEFDPELFEYAWQVIIDRHAALRTGFIWRDVRQPMQVVRKSVPTSFRFEDLRDMESTMQQARVDEYLRSDQEAGFQLDRAPLMRFCLLRLADEHWRFVWSSHHLIVDRWCLGQVYRELDYYYGARRSSGEPSSSSAAPSFKEYISWTLRQDKAATLEYWRDSLDGYEATGSLFQRSIENVRESQTAHQSFELVVETATAGGLDEFARRNAITPGVVAQAAWALTLNHVLESQDVLFGTTVSGRPVDIPDVDSIIGSFINNVAVRIRLPGSMQVASWLGQLQAQQFARAPHEYLSASELERALGTDQPRMQFESLFVWLAEVGETSRVAMRPVSAAFATAYPLTISLSPDREGIRVRAFARKRCVRNPEELLHIFASALRELVSAGPDTRLADLGVFTRQPGFDAVHAATAGTKVVDRRTVSGNLDTVAGIGGGREALGIDVLREVVRAEWSSVLGTAEAAVNVDFFAMGGTSLQAAALHSRLEVATRRSIPMRTLLSEPTIDGMASVLFAKDWPLRAGIVSRVRAGGERPPLFCIATPDVNTVGYSLLARHLDDAQGVYVLQAPPEDNRLRQVHPNALPELASRYIESMREVQPHGPYRFLGMCTGSHIALEMARQLGAGRETVEFFGVINTWALYSVSRLYRLNRMLNQARYYARRIRELAPALELRHSAEAADTQQAIARRNYDVPAESESGSGDAWINDVGYAAKNPGLPKLPTRVTIFRLERQPFWRIRDRSLGWSIHVDDVDIVPVSGNNHDYLMREPYISEVAGAIAERLRSVAAERNQSLDNDNNTGRTQS